VASTVQPSIDQIKLAMASINDLFNSEVIGKRNFSALDRIYTSDARILPPGSPAISGREGIKKFWSELVTAANPKSAVMTSMDIIPAGDGVVEIGKAVMTMESEGQSGAQMEVKYLVYWRTEDGLWKWHVDIWNQNA